MSQNIRAGIRGGTLRAISKKSRPLDFLLARVIAVRFLLASN